MTGRSIEYVFPDARRRTPRRRRACSRSTGLGRRGEFADVSFTVRAGEVVGLAGLVGLRPLGDPRDGLRRAPADRGHRAVRGRTLRPGSVPAAVRAGMGLAPEERKSQGLLMSRAGVPQRLAAGAEPLRPGGLPARRRGARGGGRGHGAARRAPGRPDAAGAHALRRQPAEGRARALAAGGVLGAAARRADPRRRRRGAQRDLRAGPPAGRPAASPSCWCPARCPRCSAWPTGSWSCARGGSCARRRRPSSTRAGCSTWSWRAGSGRERR